MGDLQSGRARDLHAALLELDLSCPGPAKVRKEHVLDGRRRPTPSHDRQQHRSDGRGGCNLGDAERCVGPSPIGHNIRLKRQSVAAQRDKCEQRQEQADGDEVQHGRGRLLGAQRLS